LRHARDVPGGVTAGLLLGECEDLVDGRERDCDGHGPHLIVLTYEDVDAAVCHAPPHWGIEAVADLERAPLCPVRVFDALQMP